MKFYYCEYCGIKQPNLNLLVTGYCLYNPDRAHGRHKLYEGPEKSLYHCKYCGAKYPNLKQLVMGDCLYSPHRKHSPAL